MSFVPIPFRFVLHLSHLSFFHSLQALQDALSNLSLLKSNPISLSLSTPPSISLPHYPFPLSSPTMSSQGTIVIGLTGGIASGKSTVGKELHELGAVHIDADKLGHSVYEKDTHAYNQIISTFGEELKGESGEIDRRKLGGIVFSSKDEMKKLTDIVWPEIRKKAEEIIEREREKQTKCVVLEAAILIEAGWNASVDKVWVVSVPREKAVERMRERNGFSKEEAEKRIDSQLTNEEREREADVTIVNDSSLLSLKQKVHEAYQTMTSKL